MLIMCLNWTGTDGKWLWKNTNIKRDTHNNFVFQSARDVEKCQTTDGHNVHISIALMPKKFLMLKGP